METLTTFEVRIEEIPGRKIKKESDEPRQRKPAYPKSRWTDMAVEMLLRLEVTSTKKAVARVFHAWP